MLRVYVKHPFFGELRLEAGFLSWAQVIDVAGRAVRADWESEEGVDPAQLDLVARFVREVGRFDTIARAALALDEDEDGVGRYIEHHRRGSMTRDEFLAKLVLVKVWFVPEDDDEMAVFDYTIDPDATRDVVAVRFDAAGNLASIACES